MAGRLQDRVALVTGGGTGIGRAAAVRCAREGARVAISGRTVATLEATAAEIRAAGGEALAIPADVSREDDVRAMVQATLDRFGGLDVLVLSAGWEGPTGIPITEVTLADWDKLMAVNVTHLFLCAKHSIPALKERRGAIVVVASDSSFVATPNAVPYCTSKGAALMFTKALAVDLRPDGVRVNCICPSYVDTQMLRRAVGDVDKTPAELGLEADFVSTPDLLGGQIAFLASDDAASITGTALLSDYGGMAHSTWQV